MLARLRFNLDVLLLRYLNDVEEHVVTESFDLIHELLLADLLVDKAL
jgi:hypothetical protein